LSRPKGQETPWAACSCAGVAISVGCAGTAVADHAGAVVAVAWTDASDVGTAVSELYSDSTATAPLPAGSEQPVSHQAAPSAARPLIRRNVLRLILLAGAVWDVLFIGVHALQGDVHSPLIKQLEQRACTQSPNCPIRGPRWLIVVCS
jgi:hypothetical protein